VSSTKRRWFLPETPDVMGMLCAQAEVTLEGMEALARWAAGEADAAAELRDAEHRADVCKRELRLALTVAFTTPVDAEDIYTLSSLLDEVMNGSKDAVRESEVMAIPTDEHVLAMTGFLLAGTRHLAKAFELLSLPPGGRKDDRLGATSEAEAAVKAQRQLERVYRGAMSSLLNVEDLREVMGRRELYRRFSRVSDGVVATAERVWYAYVKEA
jgi:uncharacterized protein Yka (UPF0111/DUF47 family)